MKKILALLLALMMVMSSLAAVYAAEGDGKKDVGPHEHELMEMANAVCHYKECTICFELFDVGEHTFKDGKCTVCGHDELINPFADVAPNAWYYNDVATAVDMGLVNGKAPDKFAPNDLITYAEIMKLAACMNEYYFNKAVTLKNGNPWYQTYVDYCFEKEIISKFANYNYTVVSTREEFLKIFAHALPEEEFEPINNVPNDSIPDYSSGSMYAKEIYMLYRAGILAGVNEKHELNPKANITRAEVATIITRMMDKMTRQKFNMAENSIDNEGTEESPEVEKNKTEATEEEPIVIPPETPEVTEKTPIQEVVSDTEVTVTPTKPFDGGSQEYILDTPLTIHKQPEGSEAEEYGTKYELEVQVYGGKTPYKYQWYYYTGSRNDTAKIENGDFAKDVTSEALILSIEKDNALLGKKIYCEITDASGAKLKTENVEVYGPFSMPVDDWTLESGKNTLIGKVADGILKKGEKVSVIRDGKVIAIGVAEDLQMFNKSLDKTVKGDNVGIVFNREKGVLPSKGDIVVKYQPSHVVDTSDVIN